ncbi:Bug family tripartite tricarboxylate transporter substrate binding protein [Variovorax paradoxus]|uniref:Bug family tripartite tricarboxylate transporter substrate binding protein n=1 Tax=Variovorax paradoxus TaxID=34073 RepID=UPI0009BA587C|nr:tripartite tricarboxylate transporter substrate binding protein [Variovorax paradoxus]
MTAHGSTHPILRTVLLAAAVGIFGGAILPSHAEATYPNKPIRILIPFPAGGAVDAFVRIIGPELTTRMGQPVIIFNKPGGGSQIAVADMMSAPADGYSVFVGQTGDFSVNPFLYKNSTYLPTRDFDGVAMLARAPQVMLTNVSGKINSVQSLKQTMSSADGSVLYGSFGSGTAPHLLGHMLSRGGSRAKFTHVPYKGFPPVMQAIMTQEIDLLFDAVPGTLNLMKTGKVIPLAVADSSRNSHLPNVPTTAEIGFPSLVMDFWLGVAVKKGTPRPIINKIHEAFEYALSNPENWKKLSDQGYSRVSMSPEKFDAFVRDEGSKMKPLIVETGVSIE